MALPHQGPILATGKTKQQWDGILRRVANSPGLTPIDNRRAG
jgi:hypothetical protein